MQQYWYVFQHKGWSFKLVRLCSCSPKTARPYNTVQPLTFFADSFIVYLFFMFFEILLRDAYMRLTDLNSVNSIVPLIPFFICILKFASHKEIFWKDIKIDVSSIFRILFWFYILDEIPEDVISAMNENVIWIRYTFCCVLI